MPTSDPSGPSYRRQNITEPQHDRDAEVDPDSRLRQHPQDRSLDEFLARECLEAAHRVDRFPDLTDSGRVLRLDQHIADPLAPGGGVLHGVIKRRVQHRVGLKALLRPAEPDDHRTPIVQLERVADLRVVELRPRRFLDHDRVGAAQVVEAALDHLRRTPDQARPRKPDQLAPLEAPVGHLDVAETVEERLGPPHARHAPHPIQGTILQRAILGRPLRVRVQHPQVGLPDVLQRARRPHQQPKEERRLLIDEQRREGQPEHQGQVLRPIPEQHLDRHVQHIAQ